MQPVIFQNRVYLSTNSGIIRIPFEYITEEEFDKFEVVNRVNAQLNPENYLRKARKNGGRNRKMSVKQRKAQVLPYDTQMAIHAAREARRARM